MQRLSVSPRHVPSPFRSLVGSVSARRARGRRRRDSATVTASAAVVESLERRALLSATTIWPTSTVPGTPDGADPKAVEVGVRFRSDGNGLIDGIRFYKGGVDNTTDTTPDTYTVNLWTNTGTNLGTGTFLNPTAIGWQTVTFSTPIAVTAGTTYVASYFAPNGNYAIDANYFANSGYDSAPLHALKDGVAGGNGVFDYSTSSTFPGSSFSSANYWVDVVYDDTGVTPKVFSVTPPNGSTPDGHVNITFSKAMNPSTINGTTVKLFNANNAAVPATVTYNAATGQATITPNSPLIPNRSYSVQVTTGAKDSTGLALAANFSSTFQSPILFGPPVTLWDSSVSPTNPNFQDNSVEVGVRFVSSDDGVITGITFYKGTPTIAPFTVNLWNADGSQRLATGTLSTSATGWVQVTFDTPVNITAGTQYVASYHTDAGYAYDANYFVDHPDYGNPPLTVVSSVDSDGNNAGSFSYADGSVFPASPTSTNFWVSPVFEEPLPPPTPPNQAPVASDESASVSEDGSVTLSLAATDDNTAPAQLTFTIASLPTQGVLTYNGHAVTAGQSFTGSPSNLVYTPGIEIEGGVADSFTYTATDDDATTPLTSGLATVSLSVTKAVADGAIVVGSDGVLRIGGTAGNDAITVLRGSDGKYRIYRGTTLASSNIPMSSVTEIRIWGRAGNDILTVLDSSVKTFLSGGLGNDALIGGFGGTIQVGGAGDDLLTGGFGNDVLIGGTGHDAMFGLSGDDVLIAGDVSPAESLTTLRALSAEWVASHATTAQEATAIDQVVTDTTTDLLSGGGGSDWFILSKGDLALDASTLFGSHDVITYVT